MVKSAKVGVLAISGMQKDCSVSLIVGGGITVIIIDTVEEDDGHIVPPSTV